MLMGIEDDDIRKVRDATDIVALISQHLQLRRVGRRWTGLCPFHNEKSPSFSVNDELGVYYCFGCGQKGDAITFVRELEHLDFVGAVEHLAAKANIALTYTNKNEGKDRRRRSQLTDAVELAVEWYHQRLLTSPDAAGARGYLRSRGFDGDEVRAYRIGWAPDGWDVFAQSVKMPRDVFVEAGLGFVNKRGRLQDHFRGRVLFPIFDSNSTPVGFGGRILPGGDGPKYLRGLHRRDRFRPSWHEPGNRHLRYCADRRSREDAEAFRPSDCVGFRRRRGWSGRSRTHL